MERRKFLIGAGSLAAGGAAALGSGAFTSVQADRTVSVSTAADNDAFLALDPSNSTNQAYASNAGSGAVTINLDSDAGVEGTGVNRNSTTQINDIFKVRNQGTQPVVVYVDPSSIENPTTSDGFGIDPQASNRPNGDYVNTSGISGGVEDDQISLTGVFSNPPYEYSAYVSDAEQGTADATEEFVLEAGESFDFGIYVNTADSDVSVSETIQLVADATVVPSSYDGQGE
ncbi:hypothetical protein GRX03_03890 [Halovenus sp. WSH3]|uniref:DUF1102 domain-containing protein n=1 Tax=Halovenus carboxidivorans TaxID=2692199 RepID=A0A6B0T0K7_9EURY|nr:hypothetical protein [Halovenus carboxidivorans]MXR50747.1 hypothetical protein [Halovenus carboxidivorans]